MNICKDVYKLPGSHACQAEANMEADCHTDSLSDRLINPEEFEPVLLTTEEHTAVELTENMQRVSQYTRLTAAVYMYDSIN